MKLMNIRFLSLILLLTVVIFSKGASAQLEFPEDKVSWSFSVEQNGDEATVIGKITMVKHWHIYAVYLPKGSFLIPTKVDLTPSSNFQLVGKLIEPKPIFEHDDIADEDLMYHSNTVFLKQKIKITGSKDFTACCLALRSLNIVATGKPLHFKNKLKTEADVKGV